MEDQLIFLIYAAIAQGASKGGVVLMGAIDNMDIKIEGGTKEDVQRLIQCVSIEFRDAGVNTKLIVLEGFSHADYLVVPNTPESQGAFRDIRIFLKRHSKINI